ncbi:MAG TPA: IclR family transcriptional regulator [Reyranella sp.]|nr:IclR family transcriptional regulator [Reyranella sp.]
MQSAARRKPTLVPSPSAETVLAESAGEAGFATTLAKGLVVLEAFGLEAVALGNLELSARTGIPRPTVARLTYTLTELGYLSFDAETAKYRLGARPLRLVRPLLAGMPFRQAARPLMQELAESVRGTVSIGLLDGTSMVYVETARSGNVGPHVPDIGLPISVVMTAMGRAASALLPPSDIALLEKRLRAEDGELWAAFRDRYRAGIRDCAERGFATCFGEYMASIHAVAAPLLHAASSRQVFSLNCGIPAFRLRPGQLESEIGPRIRGLAGAIRTLIGEQG